MRLSVFAIALAAAATLTSPAQAAVTFRFDMNVDTEFIQPTRASDPGESFFVDIWMELISEPGINAFQTNFTYNTDYVTVNQVLTPMYSELGFDYPGLDARKPKGRPADWYQQAPQPADNGGTVGLFSGFGGKTGTASEFLYGTQSIIVGRIELLVSNPFGVDTSEDSGLALLGFDSSRASSPSGSASVSTIAGPSTLSISAVPEPSAWALCFATSACLAFRRSRKNFTPASL